MRRKRLEAPEWVFPWRSRRDALMPRLAALVLVGVVFTIMITTLRIRVIPPTPWAAPKATAIMSTDDAAGRALTLQAEEGGPFPSRFVPAEWEEVAAIERTAMAAARSQPPPPYRPTLRELPAGDPVPLLRLAAAGTPVWPANKMPATAAPAPPVKTVPILHPLSGVAPQTLPAWVAELPPAMQAEPWRFLLRLDAAGHVLDCISLGGGDESGPNPLESWLRHVTFPPAAQAHRWIVVGLGFTNHPITPAPNGNESR